MGKLTFIIGGVRSGKSRLAVALAKKHCQKVIFIATALPQDEEMEKKIALHRRSRPKEWRTVVAEKDLVSVLRRLPSSADGLIIDCLTIYLSNLLLRKIAPEKILKETREILRFLKKSPLMCFIVSNIVGWGIVPDTRIGREFSELLGVINQKVAEASDEVHLVVAGIPTKLKGK